MSIILDNKHAINGIKIIAGMTVFKVKKLNKKASNPRANETTRDSRKEAIKLP